MQRPDFVRKTKQSGRGHEDIHYSYVVIRRGARPEATGKSLGLERKLSAEELEEVIAGRRNVWVDGEGGEMVLSREAEIEAPEEDGMNDEELRGHLRLDAYTWARLVVPPIKRAGHIILDTCTSEGMTDP